MPAATSDPVFATFASSTEQGEGFPTCRTARLSFSGEPTVTVFALHCHLGSWVPLPGPKSLLTVVTLEACTATLTFELTVVAPVLLWFLNITLPQGLTTSCGQALSDTSSHSVTAIALVGASLAFFSSPDSLNLWGCLRCGSASLLHASGRLEAEQK